MDSPTEVDPTVGREDEGSDTIRMDSIYSFDGSRVCHDRGNDAHKCRSVIVFDLFHR